MLSYQRAAQPIKREVDPQDVPHTHRCVNFPTCDGEWTHTPRQSWDGGRFPTHRCPKCREYQFTPTEGAHDVEA